MLQHSFKRQTLPPLKFQSPTFPFLAFPILVDALVRLMGNGVAAVLGASVAAPVRRQQPTSGTGLPTESTGDTASVQCIVHIDCCTKTNTPAYAGSWSMGGFRAVLPPLLLVNLL